MDMHVRCKSCYIFQPSPAKQQRAKQPISAYFVERGHRLANCSHLRLE